MTREEQVIRDFSAEIIQLRAEIVSLTDQVKTLRELREYDRREKERLRNEIKYWKGFVPANIIRDFPFPQDKVADAP